MLRSRRLLEVDELVVAGEAEMTVEPDPLGRVEERLGGERPALEVEQLLLVTIALEHDVTALAHTLNLGERGLQFEDAQVVQTAQRDDEVEMFIAPRIRILRTVTNQVRANRLRRGREAVTRNVEANQLGLRQKLLRRTQKNLVASLTLPFHRF